MKYCIEAHVTGIVCFGIGLTLREGNREYFYRALDRHFPGLRRRYEQTYGEAYEIVSPNHARLMRIFHETCSAHGILHSPEDCFRYLQELPEPFEQLTLM